MIPARQSIERSRQRSASARVPRLVGGLVGVTGFITLLTALDVGPDRPLSRLFLAVPLSLRAGAASVEALAGLGQMLVAGGLVRRQRRAWVAAIGLLTTAAAGHMVGEIRPFSFGVVVVALALLVATSSEFSVRPAPRSASRAVLFLMGLVPVAFLLEVAAILAITRHAHPRPSLAHAALWSLRAAVGLPSGGLGHSASHLAALGLPLLGVGVVASALAILLRPRAEGVLRHPGDDDRARQIVERYGSDTLAYFALRDDKSHFVHGDVLVAYRQLWNVALVSGDPIGPAEQVPEAFGEFVRQCRSNGWGVAVLAGGEPATELYRANGLRRIYLGDEAILDPAGFSLEGKPIRKVRQSCHRLERAGYTLQFLRGDEVDRSLTQELEDISLSWRGETGERGFTMALGRLPSPRDAKGITAVARDSHGRAQGFLHVVPLFGSEPGASLDLMRRRPQTPNGLTEWMLAMTTIELGHLGIERFSMNFATFGRLLQEGAQLSKLERVGRWWVRRLNRFFQIESLLRFNEQLHPTWEPRFIYHEGVSALPRVALAYLEAESFLRVPLVGSRAELRRRLTQPEGHVLVEPI